MVPLCGYAIIPDGRNEPTAVFSDLADALDWGLSRLGSDKFRVRFVALHQLEEARRAM
jgi:hypothetical protein